MRVMVPPCCLIFCWAVFEAVGMVIFRSLVIFPVPKSLVYPSWVRFMVVWFWAMSVSWLRLMVFCFWWIFWGLWKPCLPK